ncbi:MAG: hypothetical protein ACLRXB_09645 [Escherichia coli]
MMFWVMLVNAMAFMPTIALSNSVSYSRLAQAGLDPVTAFRPFAFLVRWVHCRHNGQ